MASIGFSIKSTTPVEIRFKNDVGLPKISIEPKIYKNYFNKANL